MTDRENKEQQIEGVRKTLDKLLETQKKSIDKILQSIDKLLQSEREIEMLFKHHNSKEVILRRYYNDR